MSGVGTILAGADLKPYFKRLVDTALFHQSVEVTDSSQFYLVDLLSRFMRSEELFEITEKGSDEVPLALLLARAMEKDPSVQVRSFKKIGDVSLYISGFFSEYVDSKNVDLDYYISMGEAAYKNLSGLLANEKTFSKLYDELSAKFVSLVCVLAEVRNNSEIGSNVELLRMYEKWLKTGDSRIRERLEKEGILFGRAPSFKKD